MILSFKYYVLSNLPISFSLSHNKIILCSALCNRTQLPFKGKERSWKRPPLNKWNGSSYYQSCERICFDCYVMIQIFPGNRLLIDIFGKILYLSVYSACNFTKTRPNLLSSWWFQNLHGTHQYLYARWSTFSDHLHSVSFTVQSHDQNWSIPLTMFLYFYSYWFIVSTMLFEQKKQLLLLGFLKEISIVAKKCLVAPCRLWWCVWTFVQ